MTTNADDDDHDRLVDPLIADDDHDRLVDPLVANYLAKQFACAQTNRLKYPLLQSHIIIISFFFIIVANSHHHFYLHCCYRNKCTNFSLSLSLDGIECFRKCWRADCKAEQAIRESKMQQGGRCQQSLYHSLLQSILYSVYSAKRICIILSCNVFLHHSVYITCKVPALNYVHCTYSREYERFKRKWILSILSYISNSTEKENTSCIVIKCYHCKSQ